MSILFQFGLHQMRASKDEGKPEPQTLIKFGNPYFKDTGGVVSNRKYIISIAHMPHIDIPILAVCRMFVP